MSAAYIDGFADNKIHIALSHSSKVENAKALCGYVVHMFGVYPVAEDEAGVLKLLPTIFGNEVCFECLVKYNVRK